MDVVVTLETDRVERKSENDNYRIAVVVAGV